MNTPQPPSPRRRLQALLAIPDSQRTDAEWDELNELEIQLAPGNRMGAPDPSVRRDSPPPGGKARTGGPRPKAPAGNAKPSAANAKPAAGAPQGKKPFRKPRKKSAKGGGEAPPQAQGA